MEDVADKEGRTILFVSHNMGTISNLCNKGIYLKSGQVGYSDSIQKVIDYYLLSFQETNNYSNGIVFREENVEITSNSFYILEVALLNQHLEFKPFTKTWDYVRIRITYYSPKAITNGSVVLELSTLSGNRLIQYSTRPLSGLELQISKGKSYVDCIIPCLPLASGNYLMSIGLAIPMVEWLCWKENIATLEVNENDVYESSFPPTQERTSVAVEHYWEVP